MTPIFFFDLAGVFVFALTGALVANRNEMDIFGHIVLAMLPAIGGGTVRDLILDAPVFWLSAPVYIWLAVLAAIIIFFFPPRVGQRLTVIEWADAIGLALFCVMGASKAYALTASFTISVTMGVVTAVVGGILRDVVANEVPLIFHKEIYATAALMGGLIYCLAIYFVSTNGIAMAIGAICAFIIRACGLHFGWSFPTGKPRT